jgi:hypothetical protein
MILLTQAGIDDARGDQVRESIKSFSKFLGIFDDEDTKNLSRSVGKVVTRVDNNGKTDLYMKNRFKKKILAILVEDILFRDGKNKNEKLIFENVLNSDQIEIFSNPRKAIDLDSTQSELKVKVKTRKGIDDRYFSELFEYTKINYDALIKQFEDKLKDNVLNYYKSKQNQLANVQSYAKIFSVLKYFNEQSENEKEFETYIEEINREIMNETEIKEFVFKAKVVDFFTDLLPIEHRKSLLLKRKWMNTVLYQNLMHLMDKLTELFEKDFSKFENDLKNSILKHTNEYFKNSIDKAFLIEDIQSIGTLLNNFTSYNKPENFLKFINGISKYILPEGEKNRIIDEKNLLDTFSDQLLEVKKNKFNFKIWLNDELKFQVKNLIHELKQYRKENIIYGQSSFIYQGHFARMSSILPKNKPQESDFYKLLLKGNNTL